MALPKQAQVEAVALSADNTNLATLTMPRIDQNIPFLRDHHGRHKQHGAGLRAEPCATKVDTALAGRMYVPVRGKPWIGGRYSALGPDAWRNVHFDQAAISEPCAGRL